MVVLDATNKSLKTRSNTTSAISMTTVVSYWSIDGSNVWTPHQFEQVLSGVNMAASTALLLAAPSGSETARVVENIWIRFTANLNTGQDIRFLVDVGGAESILAEFKNASNFGGQLIAGQGVSMDRHGTWTRQLREFSGAATISQNIH